LSDSSYFEQKNQPEESKVEEAIENANSVHLNPNALKEKAIMEAFAVLEENGFEVPGPRAKKNKSRASEKILFRGNKTGSS
jgi:hypothetical protein